MTASITASSTRVQWMWNASPDPFVKSETIDWKLYSDVENMIIEEAYQAGRTHVILDSYSVNFKNGLQTLNTDSCKQRHVRRKVVNIDDTPVRTGRFTFTPISSKRPFAGQYGWISPFIRATAKHLNINEKQLPSKDAAVIPMIVEKAAAGIVEEGKKIGKQREAEKLTEKLVEKKHCSMKEIWECCAYLYSLESFLYKKMNEVMRLIGDKDHEQEWRDRARTLGPFCLLLWDNPSIDKATEKGTVLYRGAQLPDELIETFKDDCLKEYKPQRSFPSFTSCSRYRAKAETFGNVLFIMRMKHAFSVDIKAYSQYPTEEEELVFPGVCFTVERVEFYKSRNKYEIFLDLMQQYNQKDRSEISDDFHGGRADIDYGNYGDGVGLRVGGDSDW